MKQQVDGKQMPRGPWKYLTAQTSKQQEMDTNSLERLQRPGYTAPATHCPACTPAQKCMGRYIRNQDAQEDCCPGCKGKTKPKTQARCIMTEMKLACSTTKLAIQQAACWCPLTTADTPISQVAYKHALQMRLSKGTQQSSS